jgi:hypothetical protein
MVFLRTKGLRGQRHGAASQAWLQSNVSAWWAGNQVTDTLSLKWPKGSFRWVYQGIEFAYLAKPSIRPNKLITHLILAPDLDLRDPGFLRSWQGTTWYFIRRPSDYRLRKLQAYWPKQVYYLSEQAAVRFP